MQHLSAVSRRAASQVAVRVDSFSQLRWFLLVALAVALVFAGVSHAYAESAAAAVYGQKIARGHILVGKNKTSSRADFNNAVNSQGARSLSTLAGIDVDIVNVPPGHESEHIARLKGNPHVTFAEYDELMQTAGTVNDPNYPSEWHLPKISAPQAWDYTLGSGVTIAILDTGVDGTHPDLAPNMVAGWNFYDNNSNTTDVNGHGTACSGVAAAAANNGIGVAGVAGAAKIMPLRIADASGYALWSTAAQAVNYAADHGARVVSMSFDGASSSSTIQSAASYLRSKGGVMFVAAGNSGILNTTAPTSLITVVSATLQDDSFATWSNYGNYVGISAPGYYIMTTAMGGIYQNWWGTSVATPIVAGAAALVIAKRPDFSPSQIDSTLRSTATDLGAPGNDIYFGAGRLNAGAAVAQAAGSTPADTTPPTVAIVSPTGGTVSGTITVSANAYDNVGVARVEFRVNGVTVATDAASPYAFSWTTSSVGDGNATITAVAYDSAGNSATSAPVTLLVSNAPVGDTTPPTVSLLSPSAGSTLTGQVSVSISAADNVGVTRVDFRVNGISQATTNVPPYTFSWASTLVPDGVVTLTAVAWDAAGNTATSAPLSATVYNPPPMGSGGSTGPQVSIANPLNGAMVSGNVSVNATASDAGGTTGLTQTLYIDGVKKASATGTSLSYNWNTRKASMGTHTIKVTAKNGVGVSTSTQISVTRK